jgi:ribonuclease D
MTTWVRTSAGVAELAGALAGCRALALDTESDSLHHHREKVCLVQLASDRGHAVLIDPLAGADLSPLGPLLADPAVAKVLHGADYDVTTLKRDFGFTFGGLFDTMIAARVLGLPNIGLQAVAGAELGVALSKDSQKDDWSRRPLTPTQERYAIADVEHLLALHARLVAKLEEAGRLSWAREESDAVAELNAARRERDPEAWQRVKGARKLPRRQQAVLRAAYNWREEIARETDIPSFKIQGTETLLAIAERAPATLADLQAIRGAVPPRFASRVPALLAAIQDALAAAPEAWPRLPHVPRPIVSEATRKRIEALKKWRAAEAARLGVDVSVVLPQRLLEQVAEAPPRRPEDLLRIEGFRRWRVAEFGRALAELDLSSAPPVQLPLA